jgi:hypothetical protein
LSICLWDDRGPSPLERTCSDAKRRWIAGKFYSSAITAVKTITPRY